MKNVSSIHNCYGCGVCAVVCGKKIIDIRLNQDGFYEPKIVKQDQCTECGLCLDVCSFNHENLSINSKPKQSYAAWSKEVAVQRKCSSGGIGFELARTMLAAGFQVCGVRYNVEKYRAEHYLATTVEALIPSIGSKYIQSFTQEAFAQINFKQKYLITGSPCQVDSFRRYLRKFKAEENFVLMDFFCHGVPSMMAWKKYVALTEQQVGKLIYVSWRNKKTGWHDSWAMGMDGDLKSGEKVDWHDSYNMLIRGKNTFLNSRLSQGDVFYHLFLGDYCCNPACQKQCKYKYDASAADIRIGDLWGNTYKGNDKGVSALVCFTPKGISVAESLQQRCELIPHPFEVVSEGQMRKNAGKAYMTSVVSWMLHANTTWSHCTWKCVFAIERLLHLPQGVWRRIKRLLEL